MLFQNINDNLIYTVRVLGAVLPEQICKFFSHTYEDVSLVEARLRKHIANSDFDIDPETNRVFLRGTARFNPEVEAEMEKAIWVLVNFGAEDVRDFFVGQGPTYIVFFGTNGTAYDISVINTVADAQVAKMLRQRFTFGADKDTIIHFAVVPDKEMASAAKQYGFDYVCLLNEEHETELYG